MLALIRTKVVHLIHQNGKGNEARPILPPLVMAFVSTSLSSLAAKVVADNETHEMAMLGLWVGFPNTTEAERFTAYKLALDIAISRVDKIRNRSQWMDLICLQSEVEVKSAWAK